MIYIIREIVLKRVFAMEKLLINNLTINATFTDPCRYCSGFDYVIVNGTPVIDEGIHTGNRSGMVLRRK